MPGISFVVGTGRVGSTVVSRVLREHREILSLNEFFASLYPPRAFPKSLLSGPAFWSILSAVQPQFDGMLRAGIPMPEFLYEPGRFDGRNIGIPAICLMTLPHLTTAVDETFDALAEEIRRWPEREIGQHYLKLFSWLAKRFGGREVVERSGYSYTWLTKLQQTFAQAKYVHLYRNGPDCALSMSRHVGYRCLLLRRRAAGLLGIDDFELGPAHAALLPPGLAMVARHEYSRDLVLNTPIPLMDFGLLWSELTCAGVESIRSIGQDAVHHMSYENLVNFPYVELRKLATFFDVARDIQWIELGSSMLSNSLAGQAKRLPAADYAALRLACSAGTEALRLFDYAG